MSFQGQDEDFPGRALRHGLDTMPAPRPHTCRISRAQAGRGRARQDRANEGHNRNSKYDPNVLFSRSVAVSIAEEVLR